MNYGLVKINSILDFTKDEDTFKTHLTNFRYFVLSPSYEGKNALTSLYIVFARFLAKHKSQYIDYIKLQKYKYIKDINNIINYTIYEDMNEFQDLSIINKNIYQINLFELSELEVRKILLYALLKHLEPIEKKDI